MRFSTMTSLFNAPSRLTFPLHNTTVQSQRTGSIYDSWLLTQGSDSAHTPQSESDKNTLIKIVNTVTNNCRRYIQIFRNPNHPSGQSLESYQEWLDNLKKILQENGLPFSTEMRDVNSNKKDYILGINFYHYSAKKLKILKSLLSENLLLI